MDNKQGFQTYLRLSPLQYQYHRPSVLVTWGFVAFVAFAASVAESVPVRMALPVDSYSAIVLIYLDTVVFVEMVAQNTDYHTAYLKPPLFL